MTRDGVLIETIGDGDAAIMAATLPTIPVAFSAR